MHAVLASRMLCAVSGTQLKKITSGLEKMEKKAKKWQLLIWSVSSIQQTKLTSMWLKNEIVYQ